MSAATEKKVVAKLYQYEGHSRFNRLQAVASAAGVSLEVVKGFSVRNAMSDAEFLSKFPGGTCPAFETMDGKVLLTEASAISDYIATSNPESGLMPRDIGLAAQVRMWLFICEAEIIAPLTTINRAHAGLYEYNKGMADGILQVVDRRMKNINNHVAKHGYIVGDTFTLADITLASSLGHGYAKFFDRTWQEKYPETFAYFQRIIGHPMVKDAFGEPTIAEVTPEHVKK